MSIWKKMGKAVGRAIVKTGKATAAAVKKKNLQKQVKRMILERYTMRDFKKMLDEYDLEGPELPDRGYFRKEDYVNYFYKFFKLKEIIEDAKDRGVPIKDIMDYYIQEMEKIEEEAQLTPEEREAGDEAEGVEDIEVDSDDFKEDKSLKMTLPPPSFEEDPYEGIIRDMEKNLQAHVSRFKYADEEEFRKTVYGFLMKYISRHKVDLPTNTSSMGDIVIDDGEIIFELKYANNVSTLNQGLNEVLDYQNKGKRVVMVLLDVNEMNPEKINDYKKKYLKLGAHKVIIVKGARRVKRRKKEIRIRM
ncbi:hypothetical protein ABOONEI_2485 [Aciduliprofundum boonei T469]|nr:hypothetical protein ABOONEI_2485 [Aciduliprofundum boonei T469]